MEFPQVFFLDAELDEEGAARALREVLDDLGIENPYVLASRFGRTLASGLGGSDTPAPPAPMIGRIRRGRPSLGLALVRKARMRSSRSAGDEGSM